MQSSPIRPATRGPRHRAWVTRAVSSLDIARIETTARHRDTLANGPLPVSGKRDRRANGPLPVSGERAVLRWSGQYLIVTVAVPSTGGSFDTSTLRTSPSSTTPLASSVFWCEVFACRRRLHRRARRRVGETGRLTGRLVLPEQMVHAEVAVVSQVQGLASVRGGDAFDLVVAEERARRVELVQHAADFEVRRLAHRRDSGLRQQKLGLGA